jgi:hypothetical protein
VADVLRKSVDEPDEVGNFPNVRTTSSISEI